MEFNYLSRIVTLELGPSASVIFVGQQATRRIAGDAYDNVWALDPRKTGESAGFIFIDPAAP
jgi:hypothetical protein